MEPSPGRVGPYVLERLLGKGAMGAVYRARHETLGAVRAVKLFASLAGGPSAGERFARESRTLAGVRHPGVVAVHESGVDGGRAWFAMELVDGEPLDQLLRRGRLPVDRALDVAIQLCRGVDALHAVGVVHRDLKPANVLLGKDGRAVVIDLGLAIAPDRDERLTRTGALVGTPWYMAPEQIAGEVPTPATDVHALGLLLYELLTGVCALGDDASVQQVVARVLSPLRPRPGELDPSLPASLDEVCARAMARDAQERHPRAGALGDALEAVRRDPGPTAGRARQRRLLRRAAVAAVAVGLVALALAGARALRRPTPGEGEAAPVPTEAPTAAPPRRFTEGEEREARRGLRELREPGTPTRRRAVARAWLERFAGHPDEAEVRAALAAAEAASGREGVRFTFDHDTSGETYGRFVVGREGSPPAVAAVTAGQDRKFRHWVLTGEPRGGRGRESWREEYVLEAPSAPTALAVRGDRRIVGAVLTEGLLVRMEPYAPQPAIDRVGIVGAMRSVSYSPNGAYAVAADLLDKGGPGERADGVRVVAIKERRAYDAVGSARSAARDAVVTSDGLVIVGYGAGFSLANDEEQAVKAWDLAAGTLRWELPLLSRVTCLALSPDEAVVALGTSSGTVQLVPLASPAGRVDLTADALTDHVLGVMAQGGAGTPLRGAGMIALCWRADGARLCTLSDAGEGKAQLRVWDPAARREVRPAITTLGRPTRSLDVSPDGARALVGTRDGKVEVWSLAE